MTTLLNFHLASFCTRIFNYLQLHEVTLKIASYTFKRKPFVKWNKWNSIYFLLPKYYDCCNASSLHLSITLFLSWYQLMEKYVLCASALSNQLNKKSAFILSNMAYYNNNTTVVYCSRAFQQCIVFSHNVL